MSAVKRFLKHNAGLLPDDPPAWLVWFPETETTSEWHTARRVGQDRRWTLTRRPAWGRASEEPSQRHRNRMRTSTLAAYGEYEPEARPVLILNPEFNLGCIDIDRPASASHAPGVACLWCSTRIAKLTRELNSCYRETSHSERGVHLIGQWNTRAWPPNVNREIARYDCGTTVELFGPGANKQIHLTLNGHNSVGYDLHPPPDARARFAPRWKVVTPAEPERPRDTKRLEGLARHIAASAPGNRNSRFNWAAWRAKQAGYKRTEIQRHLVPAARRVGLTELEIKATLRSALL